MAAGFEGIFHVAALEGVNTFDEGGERARDGVGDEIDEQGAGDDGHEAEAKEEAIEALEIGVRFAVGFQNDDVRSGLQAGGELDGVSVKTLVAQNQFCGDKFVGKAARKLRFLEQGKGADGNFAGFAEDDVAGGDASEIGGGAFADQPADDDKTEEIFARGVVVERLKNNLIEACAAEPPTGTFSASDGARNHFLGGGGIEGRSGGVEGDDFCVLVCEDEKIAVVGLPGIFAGVADGGGIAVAHVGERGEQIGFAAEGGFLLAMDSLDSERGVLRIEFDLVLDLGLRVAANDEESKAGECGGEEDEGKEELGAQAEIDWAVAQDVCDSAAGQEPGAELGERHRASRLRKRAY